MSELTPVAVAALALLVERPMHPYEMYQTLRERHEDRTLRLSVGSLYSTVNRLESAGLVRSCGKSQIGNRPERTTYELVDDGRRALHRRIDELLRARTADASALHVAIAELHHLPPAQALAALHARRTMLEEDLDDMELLLAHAHAREVPEMYYLSGTFNIAMCRAERDWLAGLIERLESGELTWPTP